MRIEYSTYGIFLLNPLNALFYWQFSIYDYSFFSQGDERKLEIAHLTVFGQLLECALLRERNVDYMYVYSAIVGTVEETDDIERNVSI